MFFKYEEKIVKVPDMACDKCASKISKALKKVHNVHKVLANPLTKEVIITYKKNLDMNRVQEVIKLIGYEIE